MPSLLLDNRMTFCRIVLRSVDNNGKLIGDLNACVVCDTDTWRCIGHPGTTKYNGSSLLLLQLCMEFDLLMANIWFRQTDTLLVYIVQLRVLSDMESVK